LSFNFRRKMRSFFCVAGILLLASGVVSGTTSSTKKGVRVGVAEEVFFAGFDKVDGARAWELSAASATSEKATLTSADDVDVWHLRGVELRSYTRGSLFAILHTDECRYDKSLDTVSSPVELSLRSDVFTATGRDWSWTRHAAGERLHVRQNVAVALTGTARRGAVHIFSQSLQTDIQRDGAAVLTFSGKVHVVMEPAPRRDAGRSGTDTILDSDALVVHLRTRAAVAADEPGGALAIVATAPAASSGPGAHADALEEINATGNVRLQGEGRHMSGDRIRYQHKPGVYTLSGKVLVTDPAQGINVTGDEIIYHDREGAGKRIEVRHHSGSPPVTLVLPSFILRQNSASGWDGQRTARITADLLSIELHDTLNRIEMRGNVHARDERFTLNSERLLVETPHTLTTTLFGDVDKSKASVNQVIAEGSVVADYDGRILRCVKAHIEPGPQRITLSGTPTVQAAQDVHLGGYRIVLHMDDRRQQRTVHVESTPAGHEPRQRVHVTLPPLKSLAAPRTAAAAPKRTSIQSDHLTMTEKTGHMAELDFTGEVTLAAFQLTAQCDRLGILADIQPLPAGAAKEAPAVSISRIHNVTAIGHVRLDTPAYAAQGGKAVIHPRVALREQTPRDDNGLDGNEPQYLALTPHDSTPGQRPRLTLHPKTGMMPAPISPLAPPSPPADAPLPAATPVTIDCDHMEIVGGAARSRFYLNGNIELNGTQLNGHCNKVVGLIERADPAVPSPNPSALPSSEYEIVRITGHDKVQLTLRGSKVTAQTFEILPRQRKIHLAGNPLVETQDGVRANPGKRITYDWATQGWQMEGATADDGTPLTRPTIRIPLRGEWNFPATPAAPPKPR
jgi:lipopolysaccharide export system protein LptA